MTDATDTTTTATDAPAPAAAPTPDASGVWYCDQCGARYNGPGSCENQHAPAELVELSVEAAAEQGQDPAPDAAPADMTSSSSADAPPADAGAATAAAADSSSSNEPQIVEVPPATISCSSTVTTSINGVPYSGTLTVSLSKQG